MTDTADKKNIFAGEVSSLKGKNMIAVISGRRGIGKTWFAVSLAHALSLFKQKVLLFDGDCGLNNIKIQLGLNAVYDLNAVISGRCSLNQVVFNYDKGRFDIAAGNPGGAGLSTVSVGRLQILGDDLNILAQNYDKTILDMGAGMSNASKVLTGMSASAVMLCTDEPRSVTDIYSLIKLFAGRYPKTALKIVINQVNNINDGLRTYAMLEKACREFLNILPPLLGVIRQDTRVRESIRNQSTIISRYPQSEAALDIMTIAKRILET